MRKAKKLYRVHMIATYRFNIYVDVEAENRKNAAKLALDEAQEAKLQWEESTCDDYAVTAFENRRRRPLI